MAVQLLDQWLEKEQEKICQTYQDLNRLAHKEPEMVFLGDSIVEYYPVGELLASQKHLVNRGVRGYHTQILLKNIERLLAGDCLDKVFILIGTNDLGKGLSQKEIVENVERIVQEIFQRYPLVEVYLLSILPVHEGESYRDKVYIRRNQDIKAVNQAYQELAQSFVHLHYLDFYARFLDETGQLHPDFTTDGLHLSVEGYVELSRLLQEYV
ncbi:GDSL-type esterase/lipase family protein [Streptococcus pneumoniae]